MVALSGGSERPGVPRRSWLRVRLELELRIVGSPRDLQAAYEWPARSLSAERSL